MCVASMELFSDGDITLWLRKFELCAVAKGWMEADMLKRLPKLLAGKAFAVDERLSARMASEVQLWVAECEQCNRRKTPLGTTKAPMKSIKVGATYEVMGNGHPWEMRWKAHCDDDIPGPDMQTRGRYSSVCL